MILHRMNDLKCFHLGWFVMRLHNIKFSYRRLRLSLTLCDHMSAFRHQSFIIILVVCLLLIDKLSKFIEIEWYFISCVLLNLDLAITLLKIFPNNILIKWQNEIYWKKCSLNLKVEIILTLSTLTLIKW